MTEQRYIAEILGYTLEEDMTRNVQRFAPERSINRADGGDQ